MEKNKKRFRTVLRWVLWVVLVQFLLVNISASLYAYRLTHFNTDSSLRQRKPSRNILAKTWRLFTGPRILRSVPGATPSFPFRELELTLSNGKKIHCWSASPDTLHRGTVILFHGYTAQKSQMIPEAKAFLEMGLKVLMVDFRGHGRSEGNVSSLGVKETEEVKLAWDHVKAGGETNIYLYGISMGAVAVLKATADHGLDPRALILEMPFASMRSHLQARSRIVGFPGLPERPFGFLVSTWIGWQRGFNGMGHKTYDYAENIRCPVLLQWGDQDPYVLRWETEIIFNSTSSARKKLVTYPGAGHESLLRFNPGLWKQEVGAFIF